MTALLLLGPWTPLLFQGQEFGASTPFIFFTDVGDGPMREAIRKGRFEFLAQFPSFATKEVQERLPVPSDPGVFARSKLDFAEREKNKQWYDLHVDLLRLRREDSLPTSRHVAVACFVHSRHPRLDVRTPPTPSEAFLSRSLSIE